MGLPATVSVPAATVSAAVMRVLGKDIFAARSVHDSSVAGRASASCAMPSLEPPQADSSRAGRAAASAAGKARERVLWIFLSMSVSSEGGVKPQRETVAWQPLPASASLSDGRDFGYI